MEEEAFSLTAEVEATTMVVEEVDSSETTITATIRTTETRDITLEEAFLVATAAATITAPLLSTTFGTAAFPTPTRFCIRATLLSIRQV